MATRRLGKYQLFERLGRGGMAEVYRAHHLSLDRFVAIKILHAFLADDPEFKERFEKEARNIARLKHPHIVQVYDFENDPENESYFMVMELIDGPTLKDVLAALAERGELMPLAEAVRIIREAAGALAYAHSQKMIHRDVKPANLMLDRDNRVILTDFGIAKIVTGVQFTSSGGMVGTPAYMAPEQGIGDAGDERSDLYSLGVIFFQLVTGHLPYDAETPLAIILKHLNAPIPSAREANPDVPEAADAIIQRLLAKEPVDRYQTANDLIADLERLERGETPEKPSILLEMPDKFDTMTLPPSMMIERAAAPSLPPPRRRIPLWLWVLFGGIIGAAALGLLQGGGLAPLFGFLASPTPTYTLTPTITPSLTPSSTSTYTNTAIPSSTFTATLLPSPTETSSATPTFTDTPLPSATFTLIPTNTVRILPTDTPTLTPSTTLTPTETFTPSITPTPSTTLTPTLDITLTLIQATLLSDFQTATISACDFNYEIVSQVPEDAGDVAANQDYERAITLRNTGTCAWERNSALMFVSGENFNAGARIIIRDRVNVGDEATLIFTGRTPAAHEPLSGTWELRTPGNIRIGQPIIITISVFGG